MTEPPSGPEPAASPDPDAAGALPPGKAGLGVPLSVWPDLPAMPVGPRDPARCAGLVTAGAAGHVVAAFSRPGDLVAIPGDLAPVIAAATSGGRKIIGLASVPCPGGPATLPAIAGRDTGRAALAITACHGRGCCADGAQPGSEDWPDPGLLCACQLVLRPGGILAVLTASPAGPGGRLADVPGHVVASARAAGFVYAQHIVLVYAAIRDSQLDPCPPAVPAAGGPGGCSIHSDLLVFMKLGRK